MKLCFLLMVQALLLVSLLVTGSKSTGRERSYQFRSRVNHTDFRHRLLREANSRQNIHRISDKRKNSWVFATQLQPGTSKQGGLSDVQLKVVAQNDDKYPKLLQMNVQNDHVSFKSGLLLNVLQDLQMMLNFTYVPVNGKGWPRKLTPNETKLSGLGQQLMDKEVDLSITVLAWSLERAEKLSFLPPILPRNGAIFYREDPSALATPTLMLLPFSPSVWLAVALTSAIIITTLAFSFILASTVVDTDGITGLGAFNVKSAIGDYSIHTIAALTCQGGNFDPKYVWLRVIIVSAILLGWIVWSMYNAAFVASVTAPSAYIHGYDDLKRYGFQLFTNPIALYYSRPFIWDAQELENFFQKSKRLFKGERDMVLKVLDTRRKFAVAINQDGFFSIALKHNISMAEICQVSMLKARTGTSDSMVLRKDFPWKEDFVYRTALLIERGLIDLYRRRYMATVRPPCRDIHEFKDIQLWECTCAFSIFIFGAFLASLLLAIESRCIKHGELWKFKR